MSLIFTIRISRRLPTVPPVKQKTESYAEELADFDSYIDEEERKMSQSTNKSSVRDPRSSTQKRYYFLLLLLSFYMLLSFTIRFFKNYRVHSLAIIYLFLVTKKKLI